MSNPISIKYDNESNIVAVACNYYKHNFNKHRFIDMLRAAMIDHESEHTVVDGDFSIQIQFDETVTEADNSLTDNYTLFFTHGNTQTIMYVTDMNIHDMLVDSSSKVALYHIGRQITDVEAAKGYRSEAIVLARSNEEAATTNPVTGVVGYGIDYDGIDWADSPNDVTTNFITFVEEGYILNDNTRVIMVK